MTFTWWGCVERFQ